MTARLPLLAGSVLGGLAVALGAFGAHWLRDAVNHWGLDADQQTRQLEVWDVAVRYQMYHALALLVVGLLIGRSESSRWLRSATWLFIVGVSVFSGLLYALVLTGLKVLGAFVPIGGAALIAGWIAVGCGASSREH